MKIVVHLPVPCVDAHVSSWGFEGGHFTLVGGGIREIHHLVEGKRNRSNAIEDISLRSKVNRV